MKQLVVLVFTAILSTSAYAGWDRFKSVSGGTYDVHAKTQNDNAVVRVQFFGEQTHSEFYGSDKCSSDNWVYVKARITIKSVIPISETTELWQSDMGSHRSGMEGTCGDNRTALDVQAKSAYDELTKKVAESPSSYKGTIESWIKQRNPEIQSFKWILVK